MPEKDVCYDNDTVTDTAGLVSILSFIVGLVCTAINLFDPDLKARRAYPGRLVTILGGIITLLEGTICIGWCVDFNQLSYTPDADDDDDEEHNKHHKTLCQVQGFLFQLFLIPLAFYSFWICMSFFHVIESRHRHNVFLSYVKKNRPIEWGCHAAIAALSLGLATN